MITTTTSERVLPMKAIKSFDATYEDKNLAVMAVTLKNKCEGLKQRAND